MSEPTFREICTAVYYWAAFTATWLEEREQRSSALVRRHWLERHLVQRARLTHAS